MQFVSPEAQARRHCPPEQAIPAAQTFPHEPQFWTSVTTSTHAPWQLVSPEPHAGCAQWPPLHTWPLAQAFPHAPQFCVSDATVTHELPHGASPEGHADAHAPFEQTFPEGQA